MKTIKDLTSISTPDDSANVWVQDLSTPVDADRKWSLTNLVAWMKTKLGTAASANLTTSSTDTTAGSVLRVGDFGVGGVGTGITDISTYPSTVSSVVSPSGDSAVGFQNGFYPVLIMSRAFNRLGALQIGQITGATRAFINANDGSWKTWQELYHTGNYPSDTGWTTVTSLLNGWTGTVRYIKRAGMVTVTFEVLNGSSKTDNVFINLPSGYRPSVAIRGGSVSTTQAPNELTVATSGNVASGSVATDTRGSITYPVITY